MTLVRPLTSRRDRRSNYLDYELHGCRCSYADNARRRLPADSCLSHLCSFWEPAAIAYVYRRAKRMARDPRLGCTLYRTVDNPSNSLMRHTVTSGKLAKAVAGGVTNADPGPKRRRYRRPWRIVPSRPMLAVQPSNGDRPAEFDHACRKPV